ncbi:MAG TPA: PIN domain-containing protein, partial [Salinimicrobium sp.]|nr:PIN domain-containing protein [Salinimicrobium sp.]
MKDIFVDTNILIDLLYKRNGFYEGAQALFTMGDNKVVSLNVSSLTIANTHYLLTKKCKTVEASEILI